MFLIDTDDVKNRIDICYISNIILAIAIFGTSREWYIVLVYVVLVYVVHALWHGIEENEATVLNA